jgi:hypothetical protein
MRAASTTKPKNIAPDPKGSPIEFTKNNSKFPANVGKPGIISSLMKKIMNRLTSIVATTPHGPGLYFLK